MAVQSLRAVYIDYDEIYFREARLILPCITTYTLVIVNI